MLEGSNSTVNDLDQQNVSGEGRSKLRWLRWALAGVGIGAAVSYVISKIATGDGQRYRKTRGHIVDDRGTNQGQAAQILRNLRDRAFDSSDEKLAMALGRPQHEVEAWNIGLEAIDDDVIMKARGIALHRGVQID